jgi:hypothetical protein
MNPAEKGVAGFVNSAGREGRPPRRIMIVLSKRPRCLPVHDSHSSKFFLVCEQTTSGRLLSSSCTWAWGARLGTSCRAAMITPVVCRQHAIECRQMADRAPNSRVQSILIDMARMWDRLAIEAEHCNKTNARSLHPITPEVPRNGR